MKNTPGSISADIFGEAIKDYYYQQDSEDIVVHSPDFDDDIIPVSYLFRSFDQMPPIEQTALSHCSGNVLDVGCGAGSHSLYLQEVRKLHVTAIDSSPGAIQISKLRGVRQALQTSFETFQADQFDTLLFLMNGTGIIGPLNQIDSFFKKVRQVLHPEGQILIDSSDLSFLFDRDEDGGIWMDLTKGYYGEVTFELSYKDLRSAPFVWLYLDFQTLELAANKNGFNCELLHKGEHYDYLARLTQK